MGKVKGRPLLLLFIGIFIFSFVGASSGSSIEKIQVSGYVYDNQNTPLAGVSVIQKGSVKGTSTDTTGFYSIEVERGSTIVFSAVGFESREMLMSASARLTVVLQRISGTLEEIVAIGYTRVKRAEFSGAVSSVQAKDLNISTPTVGQALVGKVAGVQVLQVSGAPYVSTKIRVRGIGSINASSDPLYVIDGYPAGTNIFINPEDIETIDILKDAASAAIYGSRASGGVVLITTKRGKAGKGSLVYDYQVGINQLAKKVKLLNSNQFAQLMIDARNNTYRDLILAKGLSWNDAMYSDDNATRVRKVGNSGGVSILESIYDFANQKLVPPTINTDWQNELYRNAVTQRHNISFTGGEKSVRYALSGGYLNQPGIMKGTKQDRINFRANIDADVTTRLKVGTNLSLTDFNNDEAREGRFHQGPILGALIYMPIFKAYNEDGSLRKFEASSLNAYGFQTIENPVALATETKMNRKGVRNTYNGFATYDILKELQFKVNLGYQTYNEKYEFHNPTSLSAGNYPPYSAQAIAAAYSTARTIAQKDLLAEYTLTYNKRIGDHKIDGLLGYTTQQTSNDIISVNASGYTKDAIREITAKGSDPSNFTLNAETGKATWSLISYLARLGYSYQGKYFLTGAFRTDGSSRFGNANKYGAFPSVAGSWIVSKESFYNNWFGSKSSFRLRASWGLSGSNNIGNYNSEQVMADPRGVIFGGNVIATAYFPGAIKDSSIGWESTKQVNIGFDIGLLNERISLTANYYNSNSFNLLFYQSLPGISGAQQYLTNLRNSKVQNKGFDVQLNALVINQDDYTLGFNGNFSLNRNKVLNMGGASTIYSRGAERSYITHVTQEGYPVGMFYGFKVKGMVRQSDMANIAEDNRNYNPSTKSFPQGYVLKGPPRSLASTNPLAPGDLYFEDVNGDGVVDDNDKTVIGTPYPKFTYGFGLRASYKFVDLSASFNGSHGNQVLDGQDYYLFNMEASGNQYSVVADRYRSEAEPGNGWVYRASRGGTQSNSTRLSTFYLQDGSYFRCTNITLGVNVPGISKVANNTFKALRIYVAGDNPFTITRYKGYNPEVDYNDGANLTPGVDYGKYPLMRAYNFGIKATF